MVIDVSICIVSYMTRKYLSDCLLSLNEGHPSLNLEIIVVDNGSTDGTIEMLRSDFPEVNLIVNSENLGYSAPMNQALQAANGRFLMQLNPDTLMVQESIKTMVDHMVNHPEVGICGPKVLNSDGSFQKQCRRGEPKPLAVIGYFFRLGKLFPENKNLNGYLLNYLDENEASIVDGVSGSCMLIRREVVGKIGYLDEMFFAYQEDADYCRRTREAGWDVYYLPSAVIYHYGGQGGSRVQPFRSIISWHFSYWRYYHKHLSKENFVLLNWFFYLLIIGKFLFALVLNVFRREKFAGPRRP